MDNLLFHGLLKYQIAVRSRKHQFLCSWTMKVVEINVLKFIDCATPVRLTNTCVSY